MRVLSENEKVLERRLREAVRKMGGEALKFSSHFSTGWTDRFILMPWGKLYLAEVKTKGQTLTPKQQARVKKARRMGFTVFIVDSAAAYDKTVDYLKFEAVIYG